MKLSFWVILFFILLAGCSWGWFAGHFFGWWGIPLGGIGGWYIGTYGANLIDRYKHS